MKYIYLFCLLSVFACREKPSDTAPLREMSVNVSAVYDGAAFELEKIYEVQTGVFIKPSRLKFYISDISVENADGGWQQLLDAFLYDLDAGQTSFKLTLPAGAKKLRFGIGVPQGLNNGDPTVYPNSHPYSVAGSNGMHWNWSTGYRFIIYEGKMDSLQNGDYFKPFSFHTGMDTLYREIQIPVEDGALGATVQVDMAKVFDMIELQNDNQTHGSGKLGLATLFTDNFINALTVFFAVE